LGTGKKLIGLCLIDVSHSGSNIAERVGIVLDDWRLNDKIFSFTLDNASANASAMSHALLTDDHWYVAKKILSFLELFYECTLELSCLLSHCPSNAASSYLHC
jgi:hypothetical protein